MRPAARAALAAAAALLAAAAASAQQLSPFLGQGAAPPVQTDVYVTVVLDRLLSVDDTNYRFEAVLYIQLSWTDTRAAAAAAAATAAAAAPGAPACASPCESNTLWAPGQPCCDGVWTPHLSFVNARGMSQDRMIASGVDVGAGAAAGAVANWARVQGEYFVPLQFQAFPFDKQYLIVQMSYTPPPGGDGGRVAFVPSATGLSLFQPRTGDDVSGWTVESLDLSFALSNLTEKGEAARAGGFTRSAPGDPWPVLPTLGSAAPKREAGLTDASLNAIITVRRIPTYFVLAALLPIVLNAWLSFLVFAVPPRHLDTRLGIVVTLFLSLTALMFVVADCLPESSTVTPPQQVAIAAYVALGLIALESIVAQRIATAGRRRATKARTQAASRTFRMRWTTAVSATMAAAAAARGAAAGAAARDAEAAAVEAPAEAPPQPARRAFTAARSDRFGGIGVYAGGSDGEDGDGGGGGGGGGGGADGGHAAVRRRHVSIAAAASDGESDASGGSKEAEVRAAARRAATRPPPPGAGWARRQLAAWRAMGAQAVADEDYALHLAIALDRISMWVCIVGFNVSMVVLLVVQATNQPPPVFY